MSELLPGVWFHGRDADRAAPAGITVSKQEHLQAGDFSITEYLWGPVMLWFVDFDGFTADERQAAYEAYVTKGKT